MFRLSLKHWNLIKELDLLEASKLIVGVDPHTEFLNDHEKSSFKVMVRAISEAVSRAETYAWQEVRSAQLALQNEQIELEDLIGNTDIWEQSVDFNEMLPSWEIRNSLSDVYADFENVPILLPSDPWYEATINGGDLNGWVERNQIEGCYKFVDNQIITITKRKEVPFSQWVSSELGERVVETVKEQFFEDSKERPFGARERNSYLVLLAVLLKQLNYDITKNSKTAVVIASASELQGTAIGQRTIDEKLKLIPEALKRFEK